MKFKLQSKAEKNSEIIDYKIYKIQFLMIKFKGIQINFFTESDDRWYMVKRYHVSYFELKSAIEWAKNFIDNYEDRLVSKLAQLKSK